MDNSTDTSVTQKTEPIRGPSVNNPLVSIPCSRTLLIVYLIAIILCCVYVPWEISYQGIRASRGYAPIWSPPLAVASVDMGRLIIEIIGITAVAVLVSVVTGRRKG